MKAVLLSLAAILMLAGCSVHSDEQIAAVRAAGVSRPTVQKLEHRGVLAPEDLIELERRGVTDTVALRQLNRVGVDYVAQRDDLAKLRKAGVSPAVREALARASGRFVYERYRPFVGPDIYYYDDWGYAPGYPYFSPYNFVGVGYSGWYGARGYGYGYGHRHDHHSHGNHGHGHRH